MLRDIVSIDEDLCNGCGRCVPHCEEGAIRIVRGKARIVADTLCDGLGACLGHCPLGAIRIERREATPFDEAAVHRHQALLSSSTVQFSAPCGPPMARSIGNEPSEGTGCPGARPTPFGNSAPRSIQTGAGKGTTASELTHWPVQLRLVPPMAPFLQERPLLVAADCVPVAFADFHRELLHDRALVIACPKLDDTRGYVEKLAAMIRENDTPAITVARMEVPCCTGIVQAVIAARELAGRDVAVEEVVIGIRGAVVARRFHDATVSAS
jgi:NAD-dependent dihydropyrimidine dehydrogenase PreA subunit